jgi:periplasmic divalent cation tolerance protein
MPNATGTDVVIVLTSLPDREAALKLARTLVEKRLAACVSVLAECTSVYRWKGVIETAQEVPVQIKIRGALYPEVEAAIREHHPYELPEIVVVPVVRGLPEYLEWVTAETTKQSVGPGLIGRNG